MSPPEKKERRTKAYETRSVGNAKKRDMGGMSSPNLSLTALEEKGK